MFESCCCCCRRGRRRRCSIISPVAGRSRLPALAPPRSLRSEARSARIDRRGERRSRSRRAKISFKTFASLESRGPGSWLIGALGLATNHTTSLCSREESRFKEAAWPQPNPCRAASSLLVPCLVGSSVNHSTAICGEWGGSCPVLNPRRHGGGAGGGGGVGCSSSESWHPLAFPDDSET